MDIFRKALGRPPTQNEVQYFNQSASYSDRIVSKNTLSMIKTHRDAVYNNYVSPEAISNLKDAQLYTGQTLGTDKIMRLNDYSKVGPIMQEYIMHDPYIYKQYQKNHISGYTDTLTISKKLNIKETDKYSMVMSGWITPDMDEEYGSEYINGDEELSLLEQTVIQDAWVEVKNRLLADDDITSL